MPQKKAGMRVALYGIGDVAKQEQSLPLLFPLIIDIEPLKPFPGSIIV
jgi:hypothetical protein